jgi:uncharacterized LabA/DUF88 family protein
MLFEARMIGSTETIYAFIDSQNLNLSIKNDLRDNRTGQLIYQGWNLDFKRFFVYLKDKYKIAKAFLFIGKVDGNEQLYKFLNNAGYDLIFKPTLVFTKGNRTEPVIKGNVDAELVLHAMIQFPNYSKAIIVTGDGDYHCLVEYLEQQKKLLHVFIPNKYSYSSLLRSYRDYFIYVSELRTKLEYRK